jgi:hypothetical protein
VTGKVEMDAGIILMDLGKLVLDEMPSGTVVTTSTVLLSTGTRKHSPYLATPSRKPRRASLVNSLGPSITSGGSIRV